MCSLLAKPEVEQRCSGEGFLALSSLPETIKQSTPTILIHSRNNLELKQILSILSEAYSDLELF